MDNTKLICLSRAKLALLTTVAAGIFLLPMAAGLLTPQSALAQVQPATPTPSDAPNAAQRTTASPGTEQMLRRHITAILKDEPDYEDMAPGLENAVRAQRPQWLPRFQKLGSLKSLTFKNVGPGGFDIYEATFENGRVEFRIAPLQADGKVAGLSYNILPTPEEEEATKKHIAAGKPDPERKALVLLEIAAQQKGEVPKEIESPGLIAAATQQWPGIQEVNKQLGKFKSLQFLHVDSRGWDVYEATYEHGHMIKKVGPLTADHKLEGLLQEN